MPLTTNEARVMDLSDQGFVPLQIARKTGLTLGCVRTITSRYSVGFDELKKHNAAIARGSRDLAAAVNEAGGHR